MTKHNEGLSVGLTGVSTGRGRGEDSLSRVGDLSHIAVNMVSGVGDGLDPAVREGHGVGAADVSSGIACLSGVEVGLGVVVGNTVGVGVRLRELLDNNGGCVVGGGGVDNRGRGVGRGGVDDRGGVHQRGVVGNGVVGNGVGKGVASMDKGSGVNNGVSQMGGNSVADNGSVSNMGDMGDLGGGGGSKAEEGRDRKGLKLTRFTSKIFLVSTFFLQRLDSLF